MKDEITVAEAVKDLRKVAERFGTFGPGSEMDRFAQLVVQPLQVLSRRLDSPEVLKMLYLENAEAAKILPDGVVDLVKRLCDGCISKEDAANELQSMEKIYLEAFREMGVTPAFSKVLFVK